MHPLNISTVSSVCINLTCEGNMSIEGSGCILSHECFPLFLLVLCVSSPCVGDIVFGGGSGNRKLQKERMHVRSNTVPVLWIYSAVVMLFESDGKKDS